MASAVAGVVVARLATVVVHQSLVEINMAAPLRIQLVTWNGAKYIPYLVDSLRQQTFTAWELQVLDNGSTDDTVSLLRSELATLIQPWSLTVATTNRGFAAGHNELFHDTLASAARQVLLLNQDMMLTPQFLDCLFYFLETHGDVGAVSGRLLRWNFPDKTTEIDSLGLKGHPNHRVTEYHGGEAWREEGDDVKAVEVFGVSGALPMYRVETLREVAYTTTAVFDPDFFSYKEDVDLAWRLRLLGWHAFTILDAVAFHDRSAGGGADLSDRGAIAARRQKSDLIKFYSYRNHVLLLIKNYGVEGQWPDRPTLWYELRKAGYLFFCEPRLFWRAWWQIGRLLTTMWRRRTDALLQRRASPAEMMRWFK